MDWLKIIRNDYGLVIKVRYYEDGMVFKWIKINNQGEINKK